MEACKEKLHNWNCFGVIPIRFEDLVDRFRYKPNGLPSYDSIYLYGGMQAKVILMQLDICSYSIYIWRLQYVSTIKTQDLMLVSDLSEEDCWYSLNCTWKKEMYHDFVDYMINIFRMNEWYELS